MKFWNSDTIQQLRDLWADGHSTTEIGRRLNVSKNAICGKAHRLDLDGRDSPIIKGSKRAIAEKAPKATLPPLESARDPRLKTTAEQDNRILQMLANGVTQAFIMARFSVSSDTIRRIIGKPRVRSRPTLPSIQEAPVIVVSEKQIPLFAAPLPVTLVPLRVERAVESRQCTWLEGDRKPYVRCCHPVVEHTSWCDEHGRRYFVNWKPVARVAA